MCIPTHLSSRENWNHWGKIPKENFRFLWAERGNGLGAVFGECSQFTHERERRKKVDRVSCSPFSTFHPLRDKSCKPWPRNSPRLDGNTLMTSVGMTSSSDDRWVYDDALKRSQNSQRSFFKEKAPWELGDNKRCQNDEDSLSACHAR